MTKASGVFLASSCRFSSCQVKSHPKGSFKFPLHPSDVFHVASDDKTGKSKYQLMLKNWRVRGQGSYIKFGWPYQKQSVMSTLRHLSSSNSWRRAASSELSMLALTWSRPSPKVVQLHLFDTPGPSRCFDMLVYFEYTTQLLWKWLRLFVCWILLSWHNI